MQNGELMDKPVIKAINDDPNLTDKEKSAMIETYRVLIGKPSPETQAYINHVRQAVCNCNDDSTSPCVIKGHNK